MSLLMRQLIVAEDGATMVEYALMVALIGAALAGVVRTLGSSMSTRFASVGTTISGAGSS